MPGRMNFRVPILGGLNEQGRPDLIGDGQLQECINYEVKRNGVFELRAGFDDFPDTVNFAYQNSVIRIWTWKSSFMTEGSDRDYFILFYTFNGSLWLLHHIGGEWVPYNDEPIFTDLGIPSITVTELGLYLVDGRDNNIAKYIKVLHDGRVIFGDIGLPAPIARGYIAGVGAHNRYAPDDSVDIGMGIRRGSCLFFCYTMVTEDGIESNPSPLFAYDDLNYIYLDEDTYLPSQYWQRTVINGLRTLIQDNSELLETVKYFNIYMSDVLYTEGVTSRTQLRLASRITFAHMNDENTYVSTSPFTGQEVSYENDIACKGDDICYTGGVLFIANANNRIDFPFQFDHYFRITLGNRNSRNYTNGAYWIRIHETDLVDGEGNQLYEMGDLFTGNNVLPAMLSRLRIFDNDLTTMLPVVYRRYDENPYFDILVKVPYVTAQYDHDIYLCIGGEGVPNALGGVNFDTPEYGRWMSIYTEWADQSVLRPNRVREENAIVSCSNEWHPTNLVPNRTNGNRNLLFEGNVSWQILGNIPRVNVLGVPVILPHPSTNNQNVVRVTGEGSRIQTELIDKTFPESGYAYVSFCITNMTAHMGVVEILAIQRQAADYIILWARFDRFYPANPANNQGEWRIYVTVSRGSGNNTTTPSIVLPKPHGVENYYTCFAFFSWDKATRRTYLYVNAILRPDNNIVVDQGTERIDIDESHFPDNSDFRVYAGNSWGTTQHQTYYSQIYASAGTYINIIENIRQFMNFVPYFPEDWIGYNPNDLTQSNITIAEGKTIEYDTRMGMVKFSSLGGRTFPDLNYVFAKGKITRIIPAPQYLKEAGYLNCVVVFGEDWRQRLLLSGSPEGWQAQINEILMDEKRHFGLSEYSRNALIMVSDALYWISGNKFLRESADGMIALNAPEGVEIVNIPYPEQKDEIFIWYNAIDNQLIIQCRAIHDPKKGVPLDPAIDYMNI